MTHVLAWVFAGGFLAAIVLFFTMVFTEMRTKRTTGRMRTSAETGSGSLKKRQRR